MERQKAWNGTAEGKVRPKERKNKGMMKIKAENKGAVKGKAKSIIKKWHGAAKGVAAWQKALHGTVEAKDRSKAKKNKA